jgi:hypothetical protein
VLLGLSRVRGALTEEPYDVRRLLDSLCRAATSQPMRNGAWGMALWAAAELDLAAPATAAAGLSQLAADPSSLVGWTAQDLGLSLSGACAQARRDSSWHALAQILRDVMMERFRGPGALFRDSGRGARRHFATFATQVYAGLALYHYGELFEDPAALAAADAIVRKLIELQGPLGEWPWLYWPERDQVLDPYEVYSVHQHGMGPALLHHAVAREIPGAKAALEKGFAWIFGANLMQRTMLVPELQLIYRSQARRGSSGKREARVLRGAMSVITGKSFWPTDSSSLRLTEEMRSYEFGWLLWSFGGRADYRKLTHDPNFAQNLESGPSRDPVPVEAARAEHSGA